MMSSELIRNGFQLSSGSPPEGDTKLHTVLFREVTRQRACETLKNGNYSKWVSVAIYRKSKTLFCTGLWKKKGNILTCQEFPSVELETENKTKDVRVQLWVTGETEHVNIWQMFDTTENQKYYKMQKTCKRWQETCLYCQWALWEKDKTFIACQTTYCHAAPKWL